MKNTLKKFKTNLGKNKFVLLAFLVVWIAIVYFSIVVYKPTMGMESIGNKEYDEVVEINRNVSIEQSARVVNNAKSVSIKFATFARKNKGNLTIEVIGSHTGKTYVNQTVNVKDVQDNAFLTVALDETLNVRNDNAVIFKLSSDSEEKQGVGVYYSFADVLENGELTINGEHIDGDLSCEFLIDNEYYHTYSYAVIIWAIISFTLLIIMLVLEVRKEIFFPVMVGIFGLLFIAVLTPMSVPDEQFHYEAAYQITSKIFGEDSTQIDLTYRNYSHFLGHQNSAGAYKRLLEHFNDPLEMREKYEVVNDAIEEQPYLLYFFPQTVGVFIGRVLKMNFLRTFYLGRFTNLLFFVICVHIAIKNTPVHKTLLGILCGLPMFIQQCASYSYDSFINGMIIIILSYFLKWYFSDENISRKDIIGTFIAVLLLAPSKFVYGLFVLPFVFVPSDRFGSRKRKALIILLISAPVIYMFAKMLIPQIIRVFNRIDDTYGNTDVPEINSAGLNINIEPHFEEVDFNSEEFVGKPYTIGFIVEYPIHTMMMILKTIRFNLKKWFYDSLGRTLSGVSMVLPIRIIHILTAIILLASVTKEKYSLPIKIKGTFLFICVVIAMMVILGFLLAWTYKNDEMVQGVQGRYFTPLLPYFFMIFNNQRFKLPERINIYLVFIHIILVFETILYIMSFTFVN